MLRSSSFIATPPGATIKEQLNDRSMSQKEFAARMDLSQKHISKLINGEVQLTADVAVRLEIVLGVPARFWNNLEAIYREKLIKAEAENAMETDEELAKQLPYSEMANFGWIPATKDSKEKVVYLRKYFEVVDLHLLGDSQITKIACRRLAVTEKSDFALMAWAQQAKLCARNISTEALDVKGLKKAIPEIREMSALKAEEFCPRIKKLLADNGVALVFLPHLKGSFLQGATFMDRNKIVLGLTARGKDADRFWFSLFHELAHIILGHVGKADGTTEDDENKANQWAADVLIPQEHLNEFLSKNSLTDANIRKFAEQENIAPGIVVGRLQNDGFITHNMMNDLKAHYEIAV